MPRKNPDLHGNVPDKCAVALLLIDVINDLEFPDNDEIRKTAVSMGSRLARLTARARKLAIPVIYVNDNFGKWRSDFNRQVDHCLHDGVCGRALVEKLKPQPNDYFVLKPKHSGFFASALDILLSYLQAEVLILTGIAGDRCVLFTANDAFLREYRLFVPADCVVSNHRKQNSEALQLMKRVLGADIRNSNKIPLARLKSKPPQR